MGPSYQHRWTHLREYMGLTPPYMADDRPDDRAAFDDSDHEAMRSLVSWLTATLLAALFIVSVTAFTV